MLSRSSPPPESPTSVRLRVPTSDEVRAVLAKLPPLNLAAMLRERLDSDYLAKKAREAQASSPWEVQP